MAITIEPGCYFVDYLLEKSLNDPSVACYLNKEKVELFYLLINNLCLCFWSKIEEFREVGGVRIEDDVVITKDGCRLLVDVPRTVEEIEKFMSDC